MRIGAAAILITAMSLASKAFGIVRESVFAAKFGATADMDAFVMAFLLVEAIGAYFITDLASVYIPEYSRLVATGGKKAGHAFNQSVFFLVCLAAGGISLLVGFLADPFAAFVAPGFSRDTVAATASLIRFMMPTIFFSGLLGFFMAVQEAQNQFRFSSSIHIVNNVVMIAIVWWGASVMGVYAAALASGVAALAKMLVQWPGLKTCRFDFSLSMDICQPAVKNMGLAMLPVALSTSAVYLDLFITRFLASELPAGSISILSYSAKIESVSVALLVTPLVTASFPSLAATATMEDKTEFVQLFQRCFKLINLVIVPIIAFLWFLRAPVIAFLFQRGAFVAEDTLNTAQVVGFLLPAILAVSWQMFLAKALYSLRKIRVFTTIIIFCAGLDILLNVCWIAPFGLLGVASARSVSLGVSVIWMLVVLYRLVPGLKKESGLVSFFRVTFAGVGFGLCAKYGFDLLDGPVFVRLGGAFLVGGIGYLALLRGLKAPEFYLLWELRKRIPCLSKVWS